MAYDEHLDARIRQAVADWPDMAAKKMFGGVCHLLAGNMVCGVYKNFLILRLGPAAARQALCQPHVRPFDITGRAMKGWVMVAPEALSDDAELADWLAQARDFAGQLPPK